MMSSSSRIICKFAICIYLLGALRIAALKCEKQPHIIFIIIDDLGWNDVSFHGSKQIPTPNIDALASDGVILNNYYVQPICTPSRGSLMTGKYPIKLGLQHDVIYAEAPYGLPLNEIILPERLKQLGYATHGIGKWHLGFHKNEYLPVNRGFDSFFGYWSGKEDFYTHWEEGQGTLGLDFHDNNENEHGFFGAYGTDVFTWKATDIIKNHNASQPLFLYLAHQAVHAGNSYSPLQAPRNYVKKFGHIKDFDRRVFAGMVSALDDSIGQLFADLDRANLLNESILIFTTDNGAAVEGIDKSTGSNWPLRGSKYNMWEGGVRGVSFVWSPQLRNVKIKVNNNLMHISDWLPTLYSLAGGDLADFENIDGFDQWKSISSGVPTKRQEILHNIDPDWKVEAIRKGKYKLLKGSVFSGSFDGWFDKEGKRKENEEFSKEELRMHYQVYDEISKKSVVQLILLQNYNKEPLSSCMDMHFDFQNRYCPKDFDCNNNSTVGDFDPSFEGSKRCMTSVVVNCGLKPTHSSSNCNPMKAPCLFNVEDDPCEYNNLADVQSSVVEELEDLLNEYRKEAIPIVNQPLDPMANPKYHGYAWVPWQSI